MDCSVHLEEEEQSIESIGVYRSFFIDDSPIGMNEGERKGDDNESHLVANH
jgi:hypothetical protein